jgi:glycosyltransferase involved in cell wall biosynthesis
MLLSILIPTLEQRKPQFSALCDCLRRQIAENELESKVELLSLCDSGGQSIGTKRNALLDRSTGEFVVFIDDDDDVSTDYVSLVCRAIQIRPDVDCVGIRGCITFRGTHPHPFVHSIRYRDYSSRGGVYTRPPYHLNPIRRSIAASYRFREVNYSEDVDWALRVRQDRHLRSEEFVDAELYYYHSRRCWQYQWLLDRTEGLRHLLGLRLANRFQLYAAIRRSTGLKG